MILRALKSPTGIFFLLCILVPVFDLLTGSAFGLTRSLRPILIFSVLGLGLMVVTGFTGLLNLGVAAFMAIGAYTFGILTCEIYPFQIGFWGALIAAGFMGAGVGFLLGLPTLRLRGDYLAIVTLGFGEIVQDLLRNLDVITQGIQGINPLPGPSLWWWGELTSSDAFAWHYLLLAIVLGAVIFTSNLYRSRIGRAWLAVREDELAASCMGVNVVRTKLKAFACGAALCSISGALWASSLGSTGEPGNYDFQISVIALCIVIICGLGTIGGVLWGSLLMVGFNSIVLTQLSSALAKAGLLSTQNVFSQPNNWKYAAFGLALVLVMRWRPNGLFGIAESRR